MSERGPSLTRQPCNMASAGTGSGPHVVGELFKLMAGVDWSMFPIAAVTGPVSSADRSR